MKNKLVRWLQFKIKRLQKLFSSRPQLNTLINLKETSPCFDCETLKRRVVSLKYANEVICPFVLHRICVYYLPSRLCYPSGYVTRYEASINRWI